MRATCTRRTSACASWTSTAELADDVLDRFLRYVQVDTQSDDDSETYPSTAKQLDLGKMLADELREIGL